MQEPLLTLGKPRRSRISRREQRASFLFLIPAFLGLSLITYLPVLAAFGIGFTNLKVGHFSKYGTTEPLKFVGFENFIKAFADDRYLFLNSIAVTVYYALVAVVGSIIFSMIVAMLLNRKIPGRGFFRAIFYVPYILPAVAVMYTWKYLLIDNGVVNYILSGLGLGKSLFYIDANMVIPTFAMIAVWGCGNLIVIFLAGLQNVPRVYQEAAEIDGANAWHRFWHITIPSMTPIIFYNVLMSLALNLQVFVPAMTISTGGPGKASSFLAFQIYNTGLKLSDFGTAGAMSFIFFVVAAILAAVLFTTSNRWIFYEGGEN